MMMKIVLKNNDDDDDWRSPVIAQIAKLVDTPLEQTTPAMKPIDNIVYELEVDNDYALEGEPKQSHGYDEKQKKSEETLLAMLLRLSVSC